MHNVFYIPGDSVIEVNRYGLRIMDEKRNYTDRAMVHFVWDPQRAEWTNMLVFMIFDQRTATLWQGFPPYPVQGMPAPYVITAMTGMNSRTASPLAWPAWRPRPEGSHWRRSSSTTSSGR